MKKHYMLFTLLFTLLPFLNSYAEENKAITIPQLSFSSPTSGYRLEIPETILGNRPVRKILYYICMDKYGPIYKQFGQ